jgi:hypothetical protein
MYVSLLLVMATMARITTRSRAAAMMTAAVGLNPKIVVRSTLVRGDADAPSSRVSLFTEPRTSVELLEVLDSVLVAEGDVAAEPLDDDAAGLWSVLLALDEPEGLVGAAAGGMVVLPPWASAAVTPPVTSNAPSRAAAKVFMTHLLRIPIWSNGGASGYGGRWPG